jgi:RND family efflux transporter MFP subunit
VSRRNIIILVVVIAIAAGGAYWYFRNQATTAASTAAASLQTFSVARGDLVASVAAAGTITTPQTTTLTWGASGNVGQVKVVVGQVVNAGDVLIDLDPTSLDHTFVQAQADLLAAQDSLQTLLAGPTQQQFAQAELTIVQDQQAVTAAQKTLTNAQHPVSQALIDAVTAAQVNLDTAQTNSTLERVSTDASAVQNGLNNMNNLYSQVQRAQQILDDCNKISCAEVVKYQNNLTTAQNNYQAAKYAYDAANLTYGNKVNTQTYSLSTAQTALNQAKANLAAAQAGPDKTQVALAQAQLDAANGKLLADQAALADLKAQPKKADIIAAQAKIATAQDKVNQAQLTSPIHGTVMAVNNKPGDAVNSGGTAIVLADLSKLQIQISVSEVDINKIKLGQVVSLSADASPGQTYYGAVTAILGLGQTAQGVVTYPVTVGISKADAALKPGMTAAAAIVTAEHKNVLVVPNRAVRVTGGQRSVTVLFEGQQIPVQVTVGLTNDTQTEILDGGQLREGDTILANAASATTTTTNRGGGGFGGFLFGGGRGPGG